MDASDTRSAEEVFRTLAADARAAFRSEVEYFEWRALHRDASSFRESWRRLAIWQAAAAPYARSYRRIESAFPEQFNRFDAIARPIQDELLG